MGALRDNPAPKHLPKHSLLILLRSLETRGVITLPAGEALEIFLEKPIEPYLLSDGDIILCGGNTASFSEDAAARIVETLKNMGVTQRHIERDAKLIEGSARLILKKKPLKPILKERFNNFLNALIANGVIKLPEGQERQPLSTYPLSDGDIVFKGQKVSFSKAAGQEIQSRITQNQGLTEEIIGQSCNLSGESICCALSGQFLSKQIFANILMALMEHEVIQLPEGQDLGQLLYPKSASSYTPTSETLNTAQSCTDVAGGGRFQHSQRSYTPPPSAHRPQQRPIGTPAQKVSWRQGAVPEKGIVNPQRLPCPAP